MSFTCCLPPLTCQKLHQWLPLNVDPECWSDSAGLAHTLRVLYLDASSVKYAGSPDKKHMLDQVCSSIAALTLQQCLQLLKVRLCPSLVSDLGYVCTPLLYLCVCRPLYGTYCMCLAPALSAYMRSKLDMDLTHERTDNMQSHALPEPLPVSIHGCRHVEQSQNLSPFADATPREADTVVASSHPQVVIYGACDI